METIVYGICTCKRDGCIGCHPPQAHRRPLRRVWAVLLSVLGVAALVGCGGTPDRLTINYAIGSGVTVPTYCNHTSGDQYFCEATIVGTTISGTVTIVGHRVTDTDGRTVDCTEQTSTVWDCTKGSST